MAAESDMARVTREIETLAAVVEQGVRANAKGAFTQPDRRALRSEIDRCIQRLDELRSKLGG